jgi:hypothetical protein
LDDDEKGNEINDEHLPEYECAKWCYSKKHKGKPWERKCNWFAAAHVLSAIQWTKKNVLALAIRQKESSVLPNSAVKTNVQDAASAQASAHLPSRQTN